MTHHNSDYHVHESVCQGPAPKPTTKAVTVFIALSVLLAVACLVPAIAKLEAHPRMLASARHFGIPWSRYRLIGVAELLAAAGVLAGLIWAPIGVASVSGMCLLLVGALATHRRSGDRLQEATPALVALAAGLAYLAVALTR
jgi:DoxX-like family